MSDATKPPSLSDLEGIYHLEDKDVSPDGRILPLPDDQGKYALVLVFAYWCHNCSGIKPEFVKLLPRVGNRVRLYAVNGTGTRYDGDKAILNSNESEQALMKRISTLHSGFRGFPTVLLCDTNGKTVKEFEGPRTADAMFQFLQQNGTGL